MKRNPVVVETVALKGTVKSADDRNPTNSAVLLIGDSGAGKTMLACSQPNTLLIDLEHGGSHAGAAVRYEASGGFAGFQECVTIIHQLLKQKPDENGMLDFQGYKINTIVFDTVDYIQAGLKEEIAGMGNKQQMYGELLSNFTFQMFNPAMRLPINKIFIAHTGVFDNATEQEKKDRTAPLPTVTVALEGGIRNKIVYLFDYVFHMTISQQGTHTLHTKPTTQDGKWLYAKDRYFTFKGKTFPIKWDAEGKIDSAVLGEVWKTLEAGLVQNRIKEAKRTLVQELAKKGYAPADATTVIGEALDGLNHSTTFEEIKSNLNVCIEKVRSSEQKNTTTPPVKE